MSAFFEISRSLPRRAAVALVASGALFALLAPTTAEAAGPRSISPELAQISVQALDVITELDKFADTRSDNAYVVTFKRYVRLRDQAADVAAAELGIPAAMLRDAWARTDLDKQTAMLAALTQLGVAYRSNRSEPGVGFDCSGLTAYAWGVAGQDLARQSRAQVNDAQLVDRTAAEAGDLMYYPGHVMLFLGIGDAMVHSPQRGSEVEITFLTERRTNSIDFADPTL